MKYYHPNTLYTGNGLVLLIWMGKSVRLKCVKENDDYQSVKCTHFVTCRLHVGIFRTAVIVFLEMHCSYFGFSWLLLVVTLFIHFYSKMIVIRK